MRRSTAVKEGERESRGLTYSSTASQACHSFALRTAENQVSRLEINFHYVRTNLSMCVVRYYTRTHMPLRYWRQYLYWLCCVTIFVCRYLITPGGNVAPAPTITELLAMVAANIAMAYHSTLISSISPTITDRVAGSCLARDQDRDQRTAPLESM